MDSTIALPFNARELRSDAEGFDALGQLHKDLSTIAGKKIQIDCRQLGWIDGHLAAPLMTIVSHCRRLGGAPLFDALRSNVSLILRKNGFLAQPAIDKFNTTIPVRFFRLTNEVEFAGYTREHLRRKEMPRMSAALLGKIFEGIDELFANCALHSQSPVPITATGQFFPKLEKLSFTIADGGRGIDGSLKAAGITFSDPQSAIDWAMQSNNTSRQGDIPGGLGLKLLRDFIELNQGSLLVASNRGFWQQMGTRVTKRQLRNPFPGTAVVLEIKTNDRHIYDLKSPDPRNIW